MSRKTKSELSFLFKISLLFFIMYASKLAKSGEIFSESNTVVAEQSINSFENSTLEIVRN